MKNSQKYSADLYELMVQVRAKRQAVLDELNGCERFDRYNILIKELKEYNKLLKSTEKLLNKVSNEKVIYHITI